MVVIVIAIEREVVIEMIIIEKDVVKITKGKEMMMRNQSVLISPFQRNVNVCFMVQLLAVDLAIDVHFHMTLTKNNVSHLSKFI